PFYFNNKSEAGKIFISIPSDPSPMRNQSVFELNPKTFILSDLPIKQDIVIVLRHAFYDHDDFISWHNIWVSNTILENPVLIDSIDSPDKYDNLKLKLK
ncbi:MAG TPA: hypothetical protein P5267_00315, partial [Patescibacteria group bacterium]|nr:hypothetical protein [Patescibacteria group bacterium]